MFQTAGITPPPGPVWSRNSSGLKRRGLQPRLVSADCLLHRFDKAYNPAFPLTRSTKRGTTRWSRTLKLVVAANLGDTARGSELPSGWCQVPDERRNLP